MSDPSNKALPHQHLASKFLASLYAAGVTDFVVCPGSRNTPLTLTLLQMDTSANFPSLKIWRHIDERAAGYFALGIARSSGNPVAVMVTSGSAVANLYPAVMEARMSRVPLIILTADRPPELQDTGSNQTAKQTDLFGIHSKWSMQLPVADSDAISMIADFASNVAARAVLNSLESPAGPAHINIPFREPLLAEQASTDGLDLQLPPSLPTSIPTAQVDISFLSDLVKAKQGILICGPDNALPIERITELASHLGWPIIADPLSNMRNGPHNITNVVSTADTILRSQTYSDRLYPQQVIRFGGIPTSKILNQWLSDSGAQSIVIDDASAGYAGLRSEYDREVVIRITAEKFCEEVSGLVSGNYERDAEYLTKWLGAETLLRSFTTNFIAEEEEFFEGSIFHTLTSNMSSVGTVVLGNSMPVRDADSFLRTSDATFRVVGTRGVSGIDGVLSAAAGAATGDSTLLVLGDLSFIHDANGLWPAKHYDLNLKILLINNLGGGIFSFLPQRNLLEENWFEEWWGAPHNMDVKSLTTAYGIPHKLLSTSEHIGVVLEEMSEPGPAVYEIRTDRSNNLAQHKKYWAAATALLESELK